MFPRNSRLKGQQEDNSKCKLDTSRIKYQIQNTPRGKCDLNRSRLKPSVGLLDCCNEVMLNCSSTKHTEKSFVCKTNYEKYGRHSMEPHSKPQELFETSINPFSEKSPLLPKARMSLQGKSNCVKTPSPQTSSIPRLRKKPTEPSGPSLLDRPRKPHNCYSTTPEDPSRRNFDRFCLQRHPVKQFSRTPPTKPPGSNCNLPTKSRVLNVSYTILPKIQKKIRRVGDALERNDKPAGKEVIAKLPLNVTDDMKKGKSNQEDLDMSVNFHVKHSSSPIKGSEAKINKEFSLSAHNLRSSEYYNIAYAGEKSEDDLLHEKTADVSQKSLRCFSMSELNDCNVVLLVQDQFIDENYDKYMKALDQAVETLQISQTDTLLQLSEHMIRLVLTNESSKKMGLLQKIKQHLDKAKSGHQVEGMVNAAISQLKEDFEQKIFQMTKTKLTSLLAELKSAVSSAHKDIETSCNIAVENLISQLNKNAVPQLLSRRK